MAVDRAMHIPWHQAWKRGRTRAVPVDAGRPMSPARSRGRTRGLAPLRVGCHAGAIGLVLLVCLGAAGRSRAPRPPVDALDSAPLQAAGRALQQGRHNEAVQELQRVIDTDSDVVAVYGLLAAVHWQAGRPTDAAAAIDRARRRQLDVPVCEALDAYLDTVALADADTFSALNARADGDLDRALTMYQRALLRDPESAVARSAVLTVYSDMLAELEPGSRAHEAIAARREAWYQLEVGYTSMARGDHRGAVQSLQAAIELDGDLVEAYKWLGCAAAASGQNATARSALQDAYNLAPTLEITGPHAAAAASLIRTLRPTPPPPRPARQGVLYVASSPTGAQIEASFLPGGTTPAFVVLPPGTYNMRVHAEHHKPTPETVEVVDGGVHVVIAELERETQLWVASRQVGVTVRIDPLNLRGSTPALFTDMPPGRYTLSASLRGYKTESLSVELPPFELIDRELNLIPKSGAAMALRSAVLPGLGQVYGGRSGLGALLFAAMLGATSGLTASHVQYANARADYDDAYARYASADTTEDILRARDGLGSAFDEANRWWQLRSGAALATGVVWLTSVVHSLVQGPVSAAQNAPMETKAASSAGKEGPHAFVVPRTHATGATVAVHATF
ncbi:PEGA domain-containing protein [Candidatus Poribacteria bacterium]|nr:PEGA domain-containing protein [Candidatus Poribacteria bacterium]